MAKTEALSSNATRVVERITIALDGFLVDPSATERAVTEALASIPPDVARLLDHVLGHKRLSYRDAAVIQTAFGLENASRATMHVTRPPSARGVAADIGTLFASRHIAGVVDAYQNVGKNSDNLARGNVQAFDDLLRRLDIAPKSEREAVFTYALAKIALTARSVLPMPEVDPALLTFHRMAVFLDAPLALPSGGAYEQFASAAVLEAILDEFGQGGRNGLRVATKRLNATDASSKVAGDVQILRGQRTEEAFEVTANDWRTKVGQAVATLKSADLPRIHILADVEATFPTNSKELEDAGADVSVIDVATFLRTVTAIMRKPSRAAALVRLYEHLERNQPDPERVNAFVRLLKDHKLAS